MICYQLENDAKILKCFKCIKILHTEIYDTKTLKFRANIPNDIAINFGVELKIFCLNQTQVIHKSCH